VYDRTIGALRAAVDRAKLGLDDRMAAVRRLDLEARRIDAAASALTCAQFVEGERKASWKYGGRTVTGPATPTRGGAPAAAPNAAQLKLF
jgi:hypothetical protein